MNFIVLFFFFKLPIGSDLIMHQPPGDKKGFSVWKILSLWYSESKKKNITVCNHFNSVKTQSNMQHFCFKMFTTDQILFYVALSCWVVYSRKHSPKCFRERGRFVVCNYLGFLSTVHFIMSPFFSSDRSFFFQCIILLKVINCQCIVFFFVAYLQHSVPCCIIFKIRNKSVNPNKKWIKTLWTFLP